MKEAWDGDLWDKNRNLSVSRLHIVRNSLNMLGQQYISELAAPTTDDVKPCKRTVVSVATMPKRIHMLEGLIRSLKWQWYQPDQIIIAIPPFAPRTRQKFEIPEYIAKDPAIKLVELPIDFGPVSKVAAALYAETDPDTCIITVDDDNQPREYFFQKLATWAAVFPTSVVGESGWNISCITGKTPYVCGSGYEMYAFVRQDYDFMCSAEALPVYGFHQCISALDSRTVRATDVMMGVSNPLYRRWMFDDDFLDVATVVAKRKVQGMLDEHAKAVESGDVSKQASEEIVALAKKALADPRIADNANIKRLARLPPISPIFMVDDVYISAYLAKRGIARLVVPAVEKAQVPIPDLKKPKKAWPDAPKPPALPAGSEQIENVNALHGESMFNEANFAAVRYFHHLNYW